MTQWLQWAGAAGFLLLLIERLFLSGRWSSTRESTEHDLEQQVTRLREELGTQITRLRQEIDDLHRKASEYGTTMQSGLDRLFTRLSLMDTDIALLKRGVQQLEALNSRQ